ncbi:MAG: hypothetical protein EA367_19530 [Leptolyngbya sp. DLM2.Bin15]|nr:MAG: hypothetical protein EA367_19530 [Leptolyngbya sp. DLM2.Bin15]
MLTHPRKPVCLSLMSFDMPLWSVTETSAAVYQKDTEQFHILLTEPSLHHHTPSRSSTTVAATQRSPRLIWLEVSPYRVIMTMQGDGDSSYRHFWEEGVYGLSRYWLQNFEPHHGRQFRLRNFTRRLEFTQDTLPKSLRIEYELWANRLHLGRYVLSLDVHL